MRLDMRDAPPVKPLDEALFFKTVHAAFAMRRKTLVNNLQSAFALGRDEAVRAVEEAGQEARVRGEALTMQALCDVSNALYRLPVQKEGVRTPRKAEKESSL